MAVDELLRSWLQQRLDPSAMQWLGQRLESVRSGKRQAFQLAFGMVPRKTGKEDLQLAQAELMQAIDACPGWDPARWSVDHAARTLVLLSYPAEPPEEYLAALDELTAAGEVSELVALYQALPVLPGQGTHLARAVEGLRTNIKPVFAAIAHHNPYPFEQFSEAQWNQMVLKALFVDLPLLPVVGLDERINPALMRMLCDYAHERWAAHRDVSPELWRCVGPVADEKALGDLEDVLRDGALPEKQGAALSLVGNNDRAARTLLEQAPDLARDIREGRLTWRTLASA